MRLDEIAGDFRSRLATEVELRPYGRGLQQILTPFTLADGDVVSVFLKKDGDRWTITDDGNTWMQLSYDIDYRSPEIPERRAAITRAISEFGIEDHDGEWTIPVEDAGFGDALLSMIQGILKVSDAAFISTEVAKARFADEVRTLLRDAAPENLAEFDWTDPERDPQRVYPVYCRIDGRPSPLFVYALADDGKTRDATIALQRFQRWGVPFRSMAIFDHRESIRNDVLLRFSDVCSTQFSGLAENREAIIAHITACVRP